MSGLPESRDSPEPVLQSLPPAPLRSPRRSRPSLPELACREKLALNLATNLFPAPSHAQSVDADRPLDLAVIDFGMAAERTVSRLANAVIGHLVHVIFGIR
eukprot:GHVR01070840.1.p2 GENE.GHVR01070840.1~~GHVR01070840.1.p2  ORF type:complete len:101 (+),score=5.27 GHVR01070840.1:341-643(+)